MATDISNLDYLIFLAHDSLDCHIGGPASLEVAMMAVLPELTIMRPLGLNRTRELHLSQQELKDFINPLGQSLKAFTDINR
jgi:hypothetical protein